jgi:hypothetical membrane protein
MNNLKISGTLLFLAGSIILMGIITSEAFYPSIYTTTNCEISDLGATLPPNSVSYQPSATIFNTTMFTAHNYTPIIGDGGTERWVAYSVVLWLVGIGGFLLNQSHTKE